MIRPEEYYPQVSGNTYEFAKHIKLMSQHYDLLDQGRIKNLMVFMPPQHGKSDFAEKYVTRRMARNPRQHCLFTSYALDLAERGSSNALRIIQSDWWQEQFGYPIGKATSSRWTFAVPGQDGRYSCVASGISGAITGHTADFCVVDDVLRNRQDALSPTIRESIWQNYTSSVESRLPKDGNVGMITTRWHADDLPGRLLRRAKENPKASQWTVIVLAATNDSGEESYILNTATGEQRFLWVYDALWPSHFPREVLDRRRADLGEGLWQALYMCRPSMGANILFPADRWAKDETFVPVGVVIAFDCASKSGSTNDWSVGCSLGVNNLGRYKVLNIWRGKPDFHALKQQVFTEWCSIHTRYGVESVVVIEDANAGTQLLQEFEHLNRINPTMIWPVAVKPIQNKFVRAEAIAGYQNASQVSLPAEANWRESFIRELEEFPLGQNDDQCDAYVWAQAGFVRGAGMFKPQTGLPDDSHVEVYNALLDDDGRYSHIDPDADQFDSQMNDLQNKYGA